MAGNMQKVGDVFTYFTKPMVAGIRMTGSLSVGDKILIKGATTNIEMVVGSMQIEMNPIKTAKPGDEIGIKVPDKVRPNDIIYKMA